MGSISVLEWNREDTVYFNYLQEQDQELREMFIAFYRGDFAGQVYTLKTRKDISTFLAKLIA